MRVLGRAGKAARFSDGAEIAELVEFHGSKPEPFPIILELRLADSRSTLTAGKPFHSCRAFCGGRSSHEQEKSLIGYAYSLYLN